MENKKASNARDIGPMTHAVAQELRAALARKKISATKLAKDAGIARSTLHKTLNAQRAIDVEDLFAICEFLDIESGPLMDAAAKTARADLDDGLTIEERLGIDPAEYRSSNVPTSQDDFGLAAYDDPDWQERQERDQEMP